MVELVGIGLQLVVESPHVLVCVFFQILVNLVNVLSVPDTCYPLFNLLASPGLRETRFWSLTTIEIACSCD